MGHSQHADGSTFRLLLGFEHVVDLFLPGASERVRWEDRRRVVAGGQLFDQVRVVSTATRQSEHTTWCLEHHTSGVVGLWVTESKGDGL